MGMLTGIGAVILISGFAYLIYRRAVRARRADRAALQAQLDMLAATIDPEYRRD
jgi:hypothetical protein